MAPVRPMELPMMAVWSRSGRVLCRDVVPIASGGIFSAPG